MLKLETGSDGSRKSAVTGRLSLHATLPLVIKSMMVVACMILLTSAIGQDVDAIIQKHIAALGGKANLAKIESGVKEGILESANAKISVQCILKEGEGYKQVVVVAGIRNFTIVTPKAAWDYLPASGETQVRTMQVEERKAMQYLLEARGLLYDYKKSGMRINEDGKVVMEGKELLRLRCVDSLSNEFILLLNPSSYLLEKMIARVNHEGQWQETMTAYADYRELEGVMIPFSIMLPMGWVHFEKIVLNKAIDEREFMPFKNQ
jgi:hypothetical protein